MNIYNRIETMVDGLAVLLLGAFLIMGVYFIGLLIFIAIGAIIAYPILFFTVAIFPFVCYYVGIVAKKYGLV